MSTPTEPYAVEGSYRTPSLEHARVRDAMRHGVLTCPPATSLITVARMLAHNHVHAIVVTPPNTESGKTERAWAVVTDRDMLRARRDADATAGGLATTDVVTVAPDDPLDWVADRMLEHNTSHALVVGSDNERPVGMISTLDIAGIVGWGQA